VILPDTSVWVHHLRAADKALIELLEGGRVLGHHFVIGELALGNLRQRDLVLDTLHGLPPASVATNDEVLQLINRDALYGTGIGLVDAHLLASVRLTQGAVLWTRDKRLHGTAAKLDIAWRPASEVHHP
jgi:predicted nucleic acid-binding protein